VTPGTNAPQGEPRDEGTADPDALRPIGGVCPEGFEYRTHLIPSCWCPNRTVRSESRKHFCIGRVLAVLDNPPLRLVIEHDLAAAWAQGTSATYNECPWPSGYDHCRRSNATSHGQEFPVTASGSLQPNRIPTCSVTRSWTSRRWRAIRRPCSNSGRYARRNRPRRSSSLS